MILYTCVIPHCRGSRVQSTEKRALIDHYLTHRKPELREALLDANVQVTYVENIYKLIDSLIKISRATVNYQ